MKGYVSCECCSRARLLIAGSVAAIFLIASGVVASGLFSPRNGDRASAITIEPNAQTSQTDSPATTSIIPQTIPIAPYPHSPIAIAPPPRPLTPAPQLDSNGFLIHSLAKRIDERSSAELERELFKAREVAFTGPPGLDLPPEAKKQNVRGKVYVDTTLAIAWRPDLAGLPFRSGHEAMLDSEQAKHMDAFSKQLRTLIRLNPPQSATDRNPNIKYLHATLIGERDIASKRLFDSRLLTTTEAVQCLQQMFQAENGEFRRMSCELLRGIDLPEATEALVKWAVFDTEPGNRAAAVDALRKRDQKEVSRLLVRYVRFPLIRAVEHAAEALVALNCQDAIPQLIAAYEQPDPAAAFKMELPNRSGGTFRLEVVRLNHARNCMTCHAQSFQMGDALRAAIPDPERPLPPSLSTVYYGGTGEFVRADVTYLRQDFSVYQPVDYPGKWPAQQRYDYFVSVRRERDLLSDVPSANDSYRQAIRFAIVELSQRDPDTDSAWLSEQKKVAVKMEDSRTGDVARFVSLETNPGALISLKGREFRKSLLSITDDDLSNAIQKLQRTYGMTFARLALIAYLDPLTRTGEPAFRAKASRLFTAVMSDTPDEFLSTAMKNAASNQGDSAKP